MLSTQLHGVGRLSVKRLRRVRIAAAPRATDQHRHSGIQITALAADLAFRSVHGPYLCVAQAVVRTRTCGQRGGNQEGQRGGDEPVIQEDRQPASGRHCRGSG
ncbi:hypothetical protein HMPREF3113_13665 [Stenotrophomonas sp. HMSC10F06]|nr:hypothetical protein HMPREF3113_13665 [Stenotrophomonas sp. HMSC10F06]